MPSIASQLPVKFENGAEWMDIRCQCGECGKYLPDKFVRGAVRKQTNDMASVEASGVCLDCKLLTRFVYRLYADGRITGLRGDGWHTWGGKQPTLLSRLKRALGIR